MKILITGGTTFVSRFTAEYFVKKGDDVTVINRGSREQVAGVTLINCDRTALGDRLRGAHFDLILDITAYTEEHVRTLIESGVSFDDFVFVSSSAVYPETNPQPFTEEQPYSKNSVWGVYENLYREAFVFDCAMQSRPFYLPKNGEMKLQFFNVLDFCRFVEVLLEKRPEQRIFNVGNRDTVSVREWVELCYAAAGKKPELISVDADIEQREYFCFYNYEYILDVSRQYELMPDTVPLEHGLRREFDWYRENPGSVYRLLPQAVYGLY